MAFEFQVTFDSADPTTHAAFWAQALHYELQAESAADSWAALVDPDGAGPRLYFQKVPEPKAAKNRVHLDVRAGPGLAAQERADALEAECARLVTLGATLARRLEADDENELCLVMQDPEGNEFCLD